MADFIAADSLSFTLNNGNTLFSHISLSITQPLTALTGTNGVGKSVLGRCLSGELKPAGGTVTASCPAHYIPQSWAGPASAPATAVLNLQNSEAAARRIETGQSTDPMKDTECAQQWWEQAAAVKLTLQQCGLDEHTHLKRPVRSFSGGEQFRLMWAAALLQAPGLLIFDEPTNHLDQRGRRHFKDWLLHQNQPVLLISHDPELLELADSILELTPQELYLHPGNYQAFIRAQRSRRQQLQNNLELARREQLKSAQAAQDALEKQQQRAARGRAHAQKTGMDKMLRDGMKESAERRQGRQASMRSQRQQQRTEKITLAQQQQQWQEPVAPELPDSHVSPGKCILRLQQLVSGIQHPGHPPLTAELSGPFCLHIRGDNGCGKSLLLKTLLSRLPALSGTAEIRVPAACLEQQMYDCDPALSAVENFLALQPDCTEQQARAQLARVRLRNKKGDIPFAQLSGGEQMKALLAIRLLGTTTPQLLLLDEPTNHLDSDSRQALYSALSDYHGAIIAVSHDTDFIRHIQPDHELHLPEGDIKAPS